MNRKLFLMCFVAGVMGILFFSGCNDKDGKGDTDGKDDKGSKDVKSAKRPNIILLLTDDQRNDTLGCAGHPIVKTPNIDKLAADGVRFENCFVTTSICAASRASIFTGLRERTHGYTFGKPAVSAAYTQESYPALLKKSGYRTGFIGKYGCLMEQDGDIFDYKKKVNGPGYLKQADGTMLESTEVMGNLAKDFIKDGDKRPFCLSVSFHASHAKDSNHTPGKGHFPYPLGLSDLYEDETMPAPNLADPKYFDTLPEFFQTSMNRKRFHWRWDTQEKYQTNMKAYYRMLTGIDDVVGQLVKTLKEKGLDENTVIIYTADNGYFMGDRGFAGKWNHFEQSLRVPLVVYDPRLPKGKRGRVVEPTALNIDLAPTILELAKQEIPKHYQGKSLSPVIEKDPSEVTDWRSEFFCEHLMDNPIIPKWEGLAGGRYKYARYFDQVPSYEFLHDLEKDPTEFKNLVSDPEYKEVLKEMRAKVDTFSKIHPRILLAENLRCENQVRPFGIDEKKPRLSWTFKSEVRGQRQTAYQVIVSSKYKNSKAGIGDMWDSGRVFGDSNQAVYAGKPLKSSTVYYWAVKVWDKDGKETRWCKLSQFETGLMSRHDWLAKWINDGKKNPVAYHKFHKFVAPQKKNDDKKKKKKPKDPKLKSDILRALKSNNDKLFWWQKDAFSEDGFFKLDPAPLFRKDFTLAKRVARARLYITGLGYYEATLNGKRVGDHFLDPGWTDYADRVYYSTYDVTRQLKNGENCLGVSVGNGWYNPMPLRMWGHKNLRNHLAIGRPRFISQLRITYADGTTDTVVSDENWKVTEGPILRNSIYLGEIYDGRKEIPGWDKPGFDDSAWRNASEAKEAVGKLVSQPLEPIRITAQVNPVKITEPEEGVYIVDMGQNFSGLASFKFDLEKGTQVNIRYGELLHNDGTLNPLTSVCGQIKGRREYVASPYLCGKATKDEFAIRGRVMGRSRDDLETHPGIACQEDIYFAKGGGETFTPRFTWHAFRYIEIIGCPEKPTLDMIKGMRLNSDVRRVGEFSCSNEMFNSIQKICDWTFLSNIFSVQSDCPHRERFGYGGDLVNTNEAYMYNYDMSGFYAKAVTDWDDSKLGKGMLTDTAPSVGIQYCGVGWAMPHPHTQLKLYQYYGDKRIIERQYQVSKQWLDLVTQSYPTNIVDDGLSDHETLSRKSTGAKYRIELLAGGEVIGSTSGETSADGSRWETAEIKYVSGEDNTADSNVGKPLEVRLVAEYAHGHYQVDFDKVRLENDWPSYVVSLTDPNFVIKFSDPDFVVPSSVSELSTVFYDSSLYDPCQLSDILAEFPVIDFKVSDKDPEFDVTYTYPNAKKPEIKIGKNLTTSAELVNGGFETPKMINGWSQNAISSWTKGRYELNAADPNAWVVIADQNDLSSGVYDPFHVYGGKAQDGENIVYVLPESNYAIGLSQAVPDTIQAGRTYTLSVQVGNPSIYRRRASMVTPLYYQSAKMLAKMAGILGYSDDVEKYETLAKEIEIAYNEKFFDPETGICSPGSQSSQSFALYSDLIADDERQAAIDYLLEDIEKHDGHLTTGIFGTRYMLEVLSQEGYGQVIYDMVNKKTYPGWGHMLDNGATTLWEHWAFSDDTFSHSHPMFGSVSQWFFNWLGGIQPAPDAVGFDRIIIRPQIPNDLQWVNSSYDSVRGMIVSNWRKTGDTLVMDVKIPVNAEATVYVPCDSPEGITEGSVPADQAPGVVFLRHENNAAIYKVQSGTYQFVVPH